MDLDAVVQEKLEADTDFQNSIAELTDEEKEAATVEKRQELVKAEYAALADAKAKSDEIAADQKRRAEKAERDAKREPKPAAQQQDNEPVLSPKEQYAIHQAGVHIDDFDEVLKAAQFFGDGDIVKGLQHETVQATIAKRAEYRKTEQATNSRAARPGASKVSDEEIVAKAAKGEIPDAGSKEAERLFWARRGKKSTG